MVSALEHSAHDVAVRTAQASAFVAALADARGVALIRPLSNAAPGYLRLPLLLARESAPPVVLGVVRPYPKSLHDQVELRPSVAAGEPPTPGAAELAARLVALPTHALVTPADRARLIAWARALG